MSDPTQVPPAGGNPGASGDQEIPETVSRDAHRRLLDETKREREARRAAEAKLAERDRQEAERQEQALLAQKEWEKAHALKAKEAETLKSENDSLKAQRLNGQKYGAFLRALGAPLDQKWQGNVDLDQIKVGEDGEIDEATTKAYAETFKKTYHEIFTKGSGPGLPNNPPGKAGPKLSPAEWRKLPDKEKLKRRDEVEWTTFNSK